MNRKIAKALKRAALYGIVDRKLLARLLIDSTPYVAQKIKMILAPVYRYNAIDTKPFTTQFRDTDNPRERMDETVISFLLFLASEVNRETYIRTIYNPGAWETEHNWIHLFKMVTFSVFTLLYEIEWQSEYFFYLDETISELMKGKSQALRAFAERIGVSWKGDRKVAELVFPQMEHHHIWMAGSYYWRLIHWMAEAFSVRKLVGPDLLLSKQLWRDYVLESLHRTLRCPNCMHHYQAIIHKYKTTLTESCDASLSELWFNLHNEINMDRPLPKGKEYIPYPKSEFEKDQTFMRTALGSSCL